MKYPQILGLVIALLPTFAQTQTAQTSPYHWSIKVTHDKVGTPSSVLSIIVNRHTHFVAKVEGNEMKPMSRDQFAAWNVPKSAVTASFGWFAGAGDIYYALKLPHFLKIYHRAIDESDEKPQKPKLVLKLKL